VRLLLDTHVAIWAVVEPSKLPSEAVALIENGMNDVAVSVVSLWEIAIKNALVRPTNDPIGLTVADAIAEFQSASFSILPAQLPCLSIIEALPPIHRDPFDRFLVAAAQAWDAQFMTHDRELAAYGDHVTIV
jgi:PIN domain nuclease of toxin-antitoxin system